MSAAVLDVWPAIGSQSKRGRPVVFVSTTTWKATTWVDSCRKPTRLTDSCFAIVWYRRSIGSFVFFREVKSQRTTTFWKPRHMNDDTSISCRHSCAGYAENETILVYWNQCSMEKPSTRIVVRSGDERKCWYGRGRCIWLRHQVKLRDHRMLQYRSSTRLGVFQRRGRIWCRSGFEAPIASIQTFELPINCKFTLDTCHRLLQWGNLSLLCGTPLWFVNNYTTGRRSHPLTSGALDWFTSSGTRVHLIIYTARSWRMAWRLFELRERHLSSTCARWVAPLSACDGLKRSHIKFINGKRNLAPFAWFSLSTICGHNQSIPKRNFLH